MGTEAVGLAPWESTRVPLANPVPKFVGKRKTAIMPFYKGHGDQGMKPFRDESLAHATENGKGSG